MPWTDERRCSTCGGTWIDRLDFAHEDTCSDGDAERRTLALDLERQAEDAHEFTRTATAAEQSAAVVLGMHLVMAAPFQQPGQPASTSTGGTVTVRVQDGERHRIRFNGRDIPAAA
jgi:endonuclease YncB( thermonuclease family)